MFTRLLSSPPLLLHTRMPVNVKVRKPGLFVIECIPYALLPSKATFFFLLKFNVRCIEIPF